MYGKHPEVDGKETTFAALGKKLGISADAAEKRVAALKDKDLPVSITLLRSFDKRKAEADKRRRRILRFSDKTPASDVALKVGCSARYVQQVRAAHTVVNPNSTGLL